MVKTMVGMPGQGTLVCACSHFVLMTYETLKRLWFYHDLKPASESSVSLSHNSLLLVIFRVTFHAQEKKKKTFIPRSVLLFQLVRPFFATMAWKFAF